MWKILWQRLWSIAGLFILISASLFFWRVPDAFAQLDTLTVAVSLKPPLVWEDETGALTGFDIDLFDAIAAQAGLRIVYTKAEFRYLLPGIVTRLYDIGDGCITITPERQTQLLFTKPYFASGFILVAPTADTKIRSLADLTAETTVSVLEGSAAQTFAQSQSTADIHPVQNSDTVFARVETGELNSAIANETEFLDYHLRHPDTTLRTVGGLLTYEECGLAVNQADTVLLEQLNTALTELKTNGVYDTLYQRWFNHRPLPEKPIEPTPIADEALSTPTPTPTPAAAEATLTLTLTTTMDLAGIYYLTINDEATGQPAEQTAARYQLLTLAANGIWFVNESPVPLPADSPVSGASSGQSGLWFVNSRGQVEAMLLTFTPPTLAGTTEVIRKDYQMQVDGTGHVIGVYQAAYYAAELFANIPPPTAAITQTISFTGQRVE